MDAFLRLKVEGIRRKKSGERNGLPLVMLYLLAFARRGWRLVRPLVRETLEEHVKLIKDLRTSTRANVVSLRKQSAAMSAHAKALALNTAFLRKIYDNMFAGP